ncbi:GIY-YIG nuclease family protein [Sphingomonas aestuarii]
MAFWAYLIRCADGRYYTGQTDDLDRRLAEHNAGGFCDCPARRRPLELVWSESFQTRLEALEAERIVGGWSRAKKEALIAGNWSMVSHFAKPPGERFLISLETNGEWKGELRTTPFVLSEVEKRSPAR